MTFYCQALFPSRNAQRHSLAGIHQVRRYVDGDGDSDQIQCRTALKLICQVFAQLVTLSK